MTSSPSKYYEKIKTICRQINSIKENIPINYQPIIKDQILPKQINPKQKEKSSIKKIEFVTTKGDKHCLEIKIGTTVEELVNEFINKSELKDKELTFLYKEVKINTNDKRKIEDIFIDDRIVITVVFT